MNSSWTTLSEVAFNPIEGVVALSHENGVKLLFRTESFTNKLANWELFYTQVIRKRVSPISRKLTYALTIKS